MDDVLPKRKHPRLKQFDYAVNARYFITICAKDKQCIFGRIVGRALTPAADVSVELTPTGQIARDDLLQIPEHYSQVSIEKYVIMPNHVHIILAIETPKNGISAPSAALCAVALRNAPAGTAAVVNGRPTVTRIVGNYKAGVSRKVGQAVWQASFYEHIIRGQSDYDEIWQYIENNPLKWALNGSL